MLEYLFLACDKGLPIENEPEALLVISRAIAIDGTTPGNWKLWSSADKTGPLTEAME